MKNVTFVITETGEMERHELTRYRVDINDAVIAALTTNIIRSCKTVLTLADLIDGLPLVPVGVTFTNGGYGTVVIPIHEIPMMAPFAIEGTTAFPHFDGAHPVMKLNWVPPSGMGIALAVAVTQTMEIQNQYLIAFDKSMRAFRLPVSNLYADCRLCSGRFATQSITIKDAAKKTLEQFRNSPWNADLYTDAGDARRASTRKLFSWKVSNEKFTQNLVPSDWSTYCEKVGNDFITNSVIPAIKVA